ncbi:MAG: hypothetical protein J6C41_02855 [Oscillospiraceae bacterium]|nr:hypothetical protein [Oscillospiraceae bacterium]
MKRLFVCLLAICLIASLCAACGGSKTAQDAGTQPPTTTDVPADSNTTSNEVEQPQDPTLLSAPTKVLTTDELSFHFAYSDVNGNSFSGTLTVVNNASPALLRFWTGDEEYLYELADNGTITLYTPVDSWNYAADTTTSQEELRNATNSLLELLSFGGWNFTTRNPDLRYRPIEEPDTINAIAFGGEDSSWYELVNDGITVGWVAVDNQTGVFNYMETADFTFSTAFAELADVYIPYSYNENW